MSEADIPQAASVALAAFEMDAADPAVHSRWQSSIGYRLATDPGGSFVSDQEGAVVGVAQALIRERLWILSLLSVSPTLRRPGGGDGRALMNAALAYGREIEAGIIMASNDPRALRLYGSSGFALDPAFEAQGKVDPDRIPGLIRGSRRSQLARSPSSPRSHSRCEVPPTPATSRTPSTAGRRSSGSGIAALSWSSRAVASRPWPRGTKPPRPHCSGTGWLR